MPRRPKTVILPHPEEKVVIEKPKEISKSEKRSNNRKKTDPEPMKLRVERGDFFIEFK